MVTTAKQIGLVAIAAVLMAQTAVAADQQVTQPAIEKVQAAATISAKREVVVSLEDRKLALVENGQVVKIYPVAVGKPSTPSPVGTFTIERRVENPTYHHDGKTVPPGPGNPVGTRWMGLSIKGYGIHGTNEPKSIGKAASHGCIRMAKADLEELYPQVAVGDTVELVGHRDDETARLFGDGQKTAAASQPVLAEKSTPTVQPAQTVNSVATHVPAATAAATSGLLVQSGVEAATVAILTGAL